MFYDFWMLFINVASSIAPTPSILFCGYRKLVKVVNFYQVKLCLIIINTFNKNCCLYYWNFDCCCYHCLHWLVTRSIFSIGKTIVAMIIMAAEANNDGNNIKWLFVVVLWHVCCFISGCFFGDIGDGGLFL